ncbi:MAG: hypothetical protein HQL55_10770 [Magnetococcales bacterium]|nr:hypothetical protein [Magnetococcales bacterium]
MNRPFSLTLQQVDTINLCLSKALAVAQMVADCGKIQERKPGEDEPTPASLFVVMQVIADELKKIEELMQSLCRE